MNTGRLVWDLGHGDGRDITCSYVLVAKNISLLVLRHWDIGTKFVYFTCWVYISAWSVWDILMIFVSSTC
jgi:hypothetical protein